MGVVATKVELSFISRGYPFDTATLYVYCDQCGSFNVKSYVSLRKWVLIIVALGLVAAGTYATFQPGGRGYWFPLSLIVCALAFKLFWGDTDYRCRKCGSAPSIHYNTLNYPSDMGVLDVPEKLTQKRHLGYWPDMYDLEEALKPPALPFHTITYKEETTQRLGEVVRFIIGIPLVIILFTLWPLLLVSWAALTELFPGVISVKNRSR